MKTALKPVKILIDIIAMVIALCFVVFLVLILISKIPPSDAQKQYHENVEDIEIYVLNTMDRYISFQNPKYDDDSVSWQIYIRESYTSSDNKDKSYEEICEQTVALINEYLEEHPEHSMNSCEMFISFWVMEPGIGSRYLDYYRTVGSDAGFIRIDMESDSTNYG